MKEFADGVKVALYFLLAIMVTLMSICVFEVIGLVRDVRSDLGTYRADYQYLKDVQIPKGIAAIQDELPAARQKFHDYDKAALTTMREVTLASGQLRHASVDERAELKSQNLQITAAVTNLATAIKRTDDSINGQAGVLAGVTSTLAETKSTVAETNKSISETNSAFLPTIQHFDELISDPAMKAALVNLNQSSVNAVIVTQNLAEGTALAVAEEKALFKPISKLKAAAEVAVTFIGKLFGF